MILEELEMFTLRYLPSPTGYCLYLLLWSKYTWDRVMVDLSGLFIYIYTSVWMGLSFYSLRWVLIEDLENS